MKLNPDDLHIHPTKQHKDCDWYDHKEYECTNWGEFWEDNEPAFVECFAPIGSIFKEARRK